MKVHSIFLKNLHNSAEIGRISRELKKLYDVKDIRVNFENKEVQLMLADDLCLNSCKTVLLNMGFKFGRNK